MKMEQSRAIGAWVGRREGGKWGLRRSQELLFLFHKGAKSYRFHISNST